MTGNELLDIVLPRLSKLPDTSGVSLLDAINRVIEIFFERLHRRKSDVARAQFSAVTVDSEFTELPSDFRGFAGPVRLEDADGNKIDLEEMPHGQETLEDDAPKYWRLVGPFSVQIIPEAAESYTLYGSYYSMPTALEDLTDDIPWEGLMDSKFADAVILIASIGGPQSVTAEARESIGNICDGFIANRTYHPRRNKLWV